MHTPLARALCCLALAVLAAAAHGRLVGAGYRAPDAALYARAEAAAEHGVPGWRRLVAIDPRGAPLANLAHAARAVGGGWRASAGVAPRLGALALLAGAAVALGLFARRLLSPYVGEEHARAAGAGAAALAIAHPAGTALIADAAALDDLGALALGLCACAAFLRGRQGRSFAWTAAAIALAGLAALAGELAWALPIALACAELVAAHRYRPRRERTRTALNTLVFSGAACAVAPALWLAHGGESRFADGFAALARDPARTALELLGRASALILPASPLSVGAAGAIAPALVVLLLLQPALVAARAAPRLWSRMLGWWLAFTLGACALGLDVDVHPAAPATMHLVGAGAFALAVGLGAASTALSGKRRRVLPWAGAAAFAALSALGAGSWRAAADVTRELELDLAAARELYGADARVLVLDAPEDVLGVETLGGAVAALAPAQKGVEALSSDAFLMLAYEPEFGALRAERLVVLVPSGALPGGASPLRAGGSRQAVRLGPPSAAGSKTDWRASARSPDLDLDTLSYGTLLVRADRETDPDARPRAHWRVTEPLVETASVPCVRVDTGDEPTFVAELGASLAWRLGDRARKVWLEGDLIDVVEAGLSAGPPAFERAVVPTTDGADWVFPRPTTPLVEASRARGRGGFVLRLCSLKDHAWRELAVDAFGDDLLRADGAAAATAALARPVLWHLDYEVDGVPLARARGRRVGRDGTIEERR